MERRELSMDFLTGELSVQSCDSLTENQMNEQWQKRIIKYGSAAKFSQRQGQQTLFPEDSDDYRLVHWSNLSCNIWSKPTAERETEGQVTERKPNKSTVRFPTLHSCIQPGCKKSFNFQADLREHQEYYHKDGDIEVITVDSGHMQDMEVQINELRHTHSNTVLELEETAAALAEVEKRCVNYDILYDETQRLQKENSVLREKCTSLVSKGRILLKSKEELMVKATKMHANKEQAQQDLITKSVECKSLTVVNTQLKTQKEIRKELLSRRDQTIEQLKAEVETITEKYTADKSQWKIMEKALIDQHAVDPEKGKQLPKPLSESTGNLQQESVKQEAKEDEKGKQLPKPSSQSTGNLQEESVKQEAKEHEEKNIYKCSKCPKTFKTKDGLQGHWNKHVGKKLVCDKCDKEFFSPRAYQQHLEFERKGGVSCGECGKSFEQQSALNLHAATHLQAKYTCKVETGCNKKFKFKCDLVEHEKYAHRLEKTLDCPFCGLLFQAPNNLKSHIRKKHPEGF